jgi:hypothetical protein
MLALEILLALVLLLICSFAPGFLVIRHLRWSPMEKLCGSIGASLGMLYLVFGTIYCFGPYAAWMQSGTPPRFLAIVPIACLAQGLSARRDIVRLFDSFRVRHALAGFGFLLLWTLLILGVIRNYSGALWYGDWLEHFQRTLFFLHHFPTNTPILGGYQLSARPPAMNILAAFFLAQTWDRFEIFQVVFAFLNLLMFLPCCLIMSALVGPRRTFVLPLVALFAMNPVVMQSVTYTWTKAFTAFYVVLALCFYLAGLRKHDRLRITVAFLALSMGLLSHYSAGPYILLVTLHYLLCVFWKRPLRFQELATITAACGLLLATWFGWSIAKYGPNVTFGSNTSVTTSQRYQGNNLAKTAANLSDSIVPVVLRNPFLLDDFNQQGLTGAIRDKAFVFFQTNAIFGMGLIGGPLILWLLYRAFQRRFQSDAERRFWLAMIPFCVVVGIAVVGERDRLGLAHLTLLPMEILGISLLAATFPLRRALLVLVVAGCLFDFCFGIFLQAHTESLENSAQRTIFTGLTFEGGKDPAPALTPESLSGVAWANWFLKHQYALNTERLADLSRYRPLDSGVGRTQMLKSLQEDQVYWYGWYARNGGTVEFLGDHTAGKSGVGTTVLFCLLYMLMLALVREMRKQIALVPSSLPHPVQRTRTGE